MPSLGLASSLSKGVTALSSYVRDGLKLYMPFSSPKEVKFVGEGSTYFLHSEFDYIDVGNDSSIQMGTSDFSICAWIKKGRDSENSVIISNGVEDAGGNIRWFFRIDDANKFEMYSHDGTGTSLISASTITGTDWNHVALSWDRDSATGAKLYINGILDAERDGTPEQGTLTNSAQGILIGARRTTGSTIAQYWNGSMKNVAIWERALSSTEIQNVMYKTYTDLSGTLSSGLKAWWALESSTNTYLDSTSNDNDGTNQGSTVNSSLYGGATPLIPRGFDNAPTVQADAIGTGYASFNGSSDYISTGSSFDTTFQDSFSIAFWIKPDDGQPASYEIIMGCADTNDAIILYHNTDGDLKIYFKGNSDYDEGRTSSPVFTNGAQEWTYVVWTAEKNASDGFKFYKNGIFVESFDSNGITSGNWEAFDSDVILSIGAYNSVSSHFAGKLKNVGIWSGLLTQVQIQSIMEKTYSELIASEKTTLVSWWGLDIQTGTDGEAGTGGVKDEHGSNHGTLA
tara:strand:- start:3425 stop:4960 length:1536 start_codon:yes stop_codon:yes gene_type:complete